jgi:3-oxoacyl-[acyl-carrier-protein] synthase II
MTSSGRTTGTVITGVGVVSPLGCGPDALWSALLAGRSAVGVRPRLAESDLPCRLAAMVRDFDPHRERERERKKFLKVMPRAVQFGVSAARMAMHDAGLAAGDVEPDRLAVVFGAGRLSTTPQELAAVVAACTDAEGRLHPRRWASESESTIAPLWLLRQLPNMPAAHVSIEFDARGPNNTITARDASALLALAEGVNVIGRGDADCVIVGGCAALTAPVDLVKLGLFERLSRRHDDPARACRPFDRDRDGTVPGEGAGAVILERAAHARRRGATVYAEVAGIGAGCDGGPSNRPGNGLTRAVRAALSDADLSPHQLGHVNAHGKATPQDDVIEAQALHRALGESASTVPVVALKGYHGLFDAGSDAVELVATILALHHGELPPSVNHDHPDPHCRLPITREPSRPPHPTALCLSRTSNGQSAAIALRSPR